MEPPRHTKLSLPSYIHSDTLGHHSEHVGRWTNMNPSEVAVAVNVGGGRRDRRCKTGSFCSQALLKEDPRVHLGSCTVVPARTPSTDAPGERYCRGAQNELNKHPPGLYRVHYAEASTGVDAGDVAARGNSTAQRGSGNQVKSLFFCLLL